MAFDVAGARQAGYSDQEIADYLAAESRFDSAGARTSGYSDQEIIEHLGGIQRVSAARPVLSELSSVLAPTAVPDVPEGTSMAGPLASAFSPATPYTVPQASPEDNMMEITVTGDRNSQPRMYDAPAAKAGWGDVFGPDLMATLGARTEMRLAGAQEMVAAPMDQARKEYWQAVLLPDAYRRAMQARTISQTDGSELPTDLWTNDPLIQDTAARVGSRPDQFADALLAQKLLGMAPDELAAYQEAARQKIAPQTAQRDELAERRQMAAQVMQEARPNFDGDFSGPSLAFDIAANTPDLAAAFVTSRLLGATAGLGEMAATVTPEFYAQGKNMGLDDGQALAYSGLMAGAELIPEAPVLEALAKSPQGKLIIKRLIGKYGESVIARGALGAGLEGVSEAATGLGQGVIDASFTDQHISMPELGMSALRDAVVGAGIGGPLGAVSAIGEDRADAKTKVQRKFAERADRQELGDIIDRLTARLGPESPESVSMAPEPQAPIPPAAPVTMPAPAPTGSPTPDPQTSKASAPIEAVGQGAATAPVPEAAQPPAPSPPPLPVQPVQPEPQPQPAVSPAAPLTTPAAVPSAAAEPAAPPVPPAPIVPEPAPVPQSQPVSSTAQEPPTGGAAPIVEAPKPKKQKKAKAAPAPTVQAEPPPESYQSSPEDTGFVGERHPSAVKNLRVLRDDPDAPRMVYTRQKGDSELGSTSDPGPKWTSLPNGFAAREYVKQYANGVLEPVQQVRAPNGAIVTRGLDTTGKPFGAVEHGNLDELMSGKATQAFAKFFEGRDVKPAPAGALPKPTQHSAAPTPTTDTAPTAKRGTLASEDIEVEEGQIDEAELERLFGKRTAPAGDTSNRGQAPAGPPVSAEPDDADAGLRGVAAGERPDAGRVGRGAQEDGRREETGRTADGRSPRVGWREGTAIRGRNGEPLQIWRGSAEETAARDFDFAALGYATGKSAAALGVFHTASKSEAREYGVPRPAYLDLRNPKVYTPDTLPTWGSKEEAFAFARSLEAKGHDGIVMDHSEIGHPNHYIVFRPEQAILDPGIDVGTADEAPSTEGIEVQELEDKLQGSTGTSPLQPTLPGEETEVDPIRIVAARRGKTIAKEMARSRTPDVAPKRDQKLGRSPYESMWRDLYRQPYPSETPEAYEKAKNDFVLKMQNAPMKVQVRWAQQRLKLHFDFKDIEIDPGLQSREAMDAMLDAYNNLHTQSAIMGQPKEAMGFNGQLTLRIKKSLGNKHTRGMFSWDFVQGFGASKLDLARRADSFTHEWFHALDLNMLMRYTKRLATGLTGASNYARTQFKELPADIAEAFANVMRAILLTDTKSMQEMAKLTLDANTTQEQLSKARDKLRNLEKIVAAEAEREARAKRHEAEAAKRTDHFSRTSLSRAAAQLRKGSADAKAQLAARKKQVKDLEAKLAQINTDMEHLLKSKASKLHQGSAFVDFMQGRQYFSIPAELFARVGESWMGNRIGSQAGVEFLAGSPEYYNQNNSDLMKLVYPNPEDRTRIFAALDNFFSVLARNQYFEGETVAAKTPGPFSIDKELHIESKVNKEVNAIVNVWRSIANDLKAVGRMFASLRHPGSVATSVGKDITRAVGYAKEFIYLFYTPRGRLFSLEDKAKAMGLPKLAAIIRKTALKMTNDPGSGDTQEESVEREYTRRTQENLNVVNRIIQKYKLDVDNDAQMDQLYEELAKPTEQVRAELQEYADFLEEKIAEVKNDKNKVDQLRRFRGQLGNIRSQIAAIGKPSQSPQNIREASDAIRKLMDQEYYHNQRAGIDIGYKSNYLYRIYNDEAINADRPGFVNAATEVYEFEKRRKVRALNQKLAALNEKLQVQKSIARNLEREAADDRVRAQMAEVRAEIAEVAKLDPQVQAQEWLYSSQVGDMFQFDRSTPASPYTKERVLGPYADIAMSEFQDQNPISILQQYLPMSARRAAYSRHFGADHSKYMLARQQMLEEGIDPADLDVMDEQLKKITGTYQSGISKGLRTATNAVYNTLTMALLPASLFVNLFEPVAAGLRTGRVRDGLRNVIETLQQIVRLGNAKQMKEVADVIGIISSAGSDTVMQNRLFLEAEGKTAQVAEHFYRVTGMQAYTNASRIASMKLAGRYVNSWAEVLLDPNSKPEAKAAAAEELREMGVPPALHQKFANFVLQQGNMISLNALADPNNAEMKHHYVVAMHAFVDTVIGNPKPSDRAGMAFNPVGRFIMSITAFNYYFQRHVLARFGKRFQRAEGVKEKAAVAMQFVMPFLALMVAQLFARLLREWYFDEERFEKRVKDISENPGKTFFNAIDAAGGTGGFGSIYNFFFKSRYDRDLSSIFMGAAPGFLLDNFQDMYDGIRDAKDPNDHSGAAERKGVRAAYRTTVNTAMPRLLHGIGLRGPLGWLALTMATSYDKANDFAEMTVPKTANELANEDRAAKRATRSPSQQRRAERNAERRQRNIERRYGP